METTKKDTVAAVARLVLACGLGAAAVAGRAQAGPGMPADPARPPAMAPAAGAVIDKTARGAPAASAVRSTSAASAAAGRLAASGAPPRMPASAPGRMPR